LWDRSRVRLVSTAQREITTLSLPRPGPIFGVTTASARLGDRQALTIAVALGDAVAIYNHDNGHLIATLPYHRDVRRWGYLQIGINVDLDRFYLWHSPSPRISRAAERNLPSYIDELDAKGNLVRSYALPALPRTPKPRAVSALLAERLESPVFFLWGTINERVAAARRNEPGRMLALSADAPRVHSKEAGEWISVVSLACAVFTFWRARRLSLSPKQAWMWAGGAFAFNFAGFLMFRFLAEPPVLVSCPNCSGMRPIGQDQCPHCHSPWPGNAPDGTEIFDSGIDASLEPAAAL